MSKNQNKKIDGLLNKQDVDRLKMVVRTNDRFDKIPSSALYNELDAKYKNRGTLSVIAYTLKKYFDEVGEKTKSDYWGEKGSDLAQKVYKQELKSELTGNEKENWKNQKEIMDIMNNIKIQNMTDYNRFLLLAMTTFQPPLRKAFYTNLKFMTSSKQDNGKDNYLYLQKSPSKCYYIVNNDKVSKYEKFKKDESMVIEINNPDLCKLLNNSYAQEKRKYVFETEEGTPYSINSISIVLLERPFKLNFNILRSSYVSNFYANNPYPKERKELADKMRHSHERAELSYLKR